jgi:hypothetical protein
MAASSYTEAEIILFMLDTSVNPRTKRKIKKGGKIYNLLMTLSNELSATPNNPPKQIIKKLRENSLVPN